MVDIVRLTEELTQDPLGRGYSAMTDQQVADSLNANTRQRAVPITADAVKRYLFVNNIWLSIKNGTDIVAESARDALEMFDQFHVEEPEVAQTVQDLLTALVAAGHITETNKQDVLGMGINFQSRAQELGLLGGSTEIGPAHVARARA